MRTIQNVFENDLGTAHCADMYPSAPTNIPELTRVREIIRAYLRKWLSIDDILKSEQVDNTQFNPILIKYKTNNLNYHHTFL